MCVYIYIYIYIYIKHTTRIAKIINFMICKIIYPGKNVRPALYTKTFHTFIQVRWIRHAGHCWRSGDELVSDVLLWTPHMARQKQDDQLEHTFSSYVRIQDVALKTCQRRWTIGRSGERGSGISVLAAWHDDEDDIHTHSSILITFLQKPINKI